MYIIFEGVDTSGKSTQIELLKKEYKNTLFTKEPGGTRVSISKLLLFVRA
jgi:dTMP kinase